MKTLLTHCSIAAVVGVAFTAELCAQAPGIISYQGRVQVNGTDFTGTGQFKFALVDGGSNTVRQATATAVVSGGFLIDYIVTDGGAGYVTPPVVMIADPTGSGATATAQISGGAVTNIQPNQAGSGYSASPTVTIDPPPDSFVFETYWSNDGTSVAGSEPAALVSLPVQDGLFTVLLGDSHLVNMTPIATAVFENDDVHLRTWFNDGVNGFAQLGGDLRVTATGYALKASHADTADSATTAVTATTATTAMTANVAKSVDWRVIENVPIGFADNVDNNTTYSAGTGLSLGGTTFSVANGGVGSGQLATDAASLGKITGSAVQQVGSDIGINEPTPDARLHVTESGTGGTAIRGEATAISTTTPSYGVHGSSLSQQGVGVLGEALATSGSSVSPGAGVHGRSLNRYSPGVLGETTADSGTAIHALAGGTAQFGVQSEHTGTDETTTKYAIYGFNLSQASTSNARSRGVYGYAQGMRARGVMGAVIGSRTNLSPDLSAVYGEVFTVNAYAVYANGNFGASGTKSFVQPHPSDPALAIQFVSLEGNEAGTYFRGTAVLSGGVAEIPIPEEWQLVSEAEGVTVQVTPLGPARLYVAERSRERIVVRGDADCAFDYLVNGVRRGFAGHQSFIPNTAFQPTVAGMEYGRQYPKALRDVLVGNGTLKPDYTPDEATAAAKGWKLAKPKQHTQGDAPPASADTDDEIPPEGEYFLLRNQ